MAPRLPDHSAWVFSAARLPRACSRPEVWPLCVAIALGLLTAGAVEASLPELVQRTQWGVDSDALAREFGARATVLSSPIEFGDSYADVVLPNESIGGYRFTVYFQMDRRSGGLKRIHLERPRHGAVLGVYRAVLDAVAASYGAPARICTAPPTGAHGYRRAETRLWRLDGTLLRATFRDTTLGASESCLGARSPCRLTAQLFLQLGPPDAIPEPCR
ncbi:MAG TPA: hypothetical protein VFO41_14570 [Alphaproteobacteria bacterium]|nr:hypothetical protein [Alphaproteobacteria bacterium]